MIKTFFLIHHNHQKQTGMKHEWRKHEKEFYIPKNKPQLVDIPTFKFFIIEGQGNPNDDFFAEYIKVLYALSYAVKMSHKSGNAPDEYFDYTVYPLEGIWDISDEAKAQEASKLDKNDLLFSLMIRQPDFVTADFFEEIMVQTKKKKPHNLLDQVVFESITDGACVQMLHVGPYDDEPASFAQMETFALNQNKQRACMKHREIYLSDARKVSPDKLKTVLRFSVKD